MLGRKPANFVVLLAALSSSLGACQSIDRAAPTPERLEGVWRVTGLANQTIPGDSQAHIEFSNPPRLTGNAGCNRFFGVYDYQDGDLTIDETLGVSKMLCQPSEMAAENRLLSFLPLSDRVNLNGGRLELRDSGGRILITAERELSL